MTRWVYRAVGAVGIAMLGLLSGCNGFFVYPGSQNGGGAGNTGDYVYVANASTQSVAAFVVGSGTLTAVSGSPYALGFVPRAVAVNPANSIVFVAGDNGVNGFVNSYSIGSGGALTLLVSNNLGSGSEVSLDVSPDGKWLMGLDSAGAGANQVVVDEYAINTSTGQLKLEAGAIYAYSGSSIPVIEPEAIKFAPNGLYLFAAVGTGGDLVFPFATSSGEFSQALWLPPASTTTSDNGLAVNSSSTALYIARSGTFGGLAVYSIGSGGALNVVSGSPLAAGSQPISVLSNKAGTYLYLANHGDDTISGYGVSASGAVSILSPPTNGTSSGVRAMAIDNSGNYLLAIADNGSPDLAMYSYDATTAGKLDFVTSLGTGTDPTGPVAIAATH